MSAHATHVDRSASSSPITRRTKDARVAVKGERSESVTRSALDRHPGGLTITPAGRTKPQHRQPLGRYP